MHLITKFFLITLFFLFLFMEGYSQQISEEVSLVEKKPLKSYQYFNVDDYEQRTLFKVGLQSPFKVGLKPSITTESGFANTVVAVEHKLFPWLSAEVFVGDLSAGIRSFGVKAKYYPAKRESSKALRDRVNNFTGYYIGLGYSQNLRNSLLGERRSYIPYFRIEPIEIYSLYLGRQQKIDRWGYMDGSLFISYLNSSTSASKLQAGLSLQVGLGLGKYKAVEDITGTNRDEDDQVPRYAGAYSFYIENPTLDLGGGYRNLGSRLGMEVGLFEYFSLVSKVEGWYGSYSSIGESTYSSINLSAEIRRYNGIKVKERKGVFPKVFSASYFGIKGSRYNNSYKYKGLPNQESKSSSGNTVELLGVFGIQHRLGKNFMMNLSYGAGFSGSDHDYLSGFTHRVDGGISYIFKTNRP